MRTGNDPSVLATHVAEVNKTDTSSNAAVGIIGAGNIGQAFARLAVRAGRKVVISHSGSPETLGPVVAGLGDGVLPGTVAAAASQRLVVLAVRWPDVPAALSGLNAAGRIVIDATNAVTATVDGDAQTFRPADLGGKTSSEVVQDLLPGAHVVKAGNTLRAEVLAADPREGDGRRVVFLSADDEFAKEEVAALLADAGFYPIDLGALREGGRMQQMLTGPLAGLNLIKLT